MRRLLAAVALTASLAVCGCSRPSPTPASGELRPVLQAKYAAMDGAIKKKNLEPWESTLDDKCTFKQTDGHVYDKKDALQKMRDFLKTGEADSKTELEEIAGGGDSAHVVAKSHMKASYTDAHGEKHEVVVDTRSRDSWKKTARGWMLTGSVEMSHEAKRDGKSYKAD